jgi:hypothetical protein
MGPQEDAGIEYGVTVAPVTELGYHRYPNEGFLMRTEQRWHHVNTHVLCETHVSQGIFYWTRRIVMGH